MESLQTVGKNNGVFRAENTTAAHWLARLTRAATGSNEKQMGFHSVSVPVFPHLQFGLFEALPAFAGLFPPFSPGRDSVNYTVNAESALVSHPNRELHLLPSGKHTWRVARRGEKRFPTAFGASRSDFQGQPPIPWPPSAGIPGKEVSPQRYSSKKVSFPSCDPFPNSEMIPKSPL